MPTRTLRFEELRPDPEARREAILADRAPIALLLDEIQDPRNAGALFRLADAARCQMIYGFRTGDLPSLRKVQRVSRAAHKFVPFQELEDLQEVADLASSYRLVGLDITDSSRPYHAFQPEGPVLLMIGNEARGLRPELLALAEASIHIPMYGMNSSMNVAMATGIAVYGMLHRSG